MTCSYERPYLMATYLPHHLTYIAELARKGSRKIRWSAMPATGRGVDEPVAARQVPLAIRRAAKAALYAGLIALAAAAIAAPAIAGVDRDPMTPARLAVFQQCVANVYPAIVATKAPAYGWCACVARDYIAATSTIEGTKAMAENGAVENLISRCFFTSAH